MGITRDAYGNTYFEGGAHIMVNVDTGIIIANWEYTDIAKIPTVFVSDSAYFHFADNDH